MPTSLRLGPLAHKVSKPFATICLTSLVLLLVSLQKYPRFQGNPLILGRFLTSPVCTMRPLFSKLILGLHVVLDISITLVSLGFYNPNWKFDFSTVLSTFKINAYSYWNSPLDFVALSLIRQVALLIAVIVTVRGKAERLRKWMLAYDTLAIFGYMFAIVKLLVFDEQPELMTYPGVYMNTISAVILTFSLPSAIRNTILSKEDKEVAYERLASESQENTTVENGECPPCYLKQY